MSPFKQILFIILILMLLPVAFRLVLRLLVKLRLLPLILYLLAVRFFFPGWAAAHEMLSIGLLAAITAGTLAVWITPLIRHFREEHRIKSAFLNQVQLAREQGLSPEDYHFTVKNGVPILEYDR